MRRTILFMLFVAPVAVAQEMGTFTESVMPADLSARSAVSSGRSIFNISATTNDKSATIQLTQKLPGQKDVLWNLTLTGPIDKNDDRTQLAGLHGINGQTEIKFGLQKQIGDMTATFHNTPANVARWQELCHRANQADGCDLFAIGVSETEIAKIVTVKGKMQFLSITGGYGSDSFKYLVEPSFTPGKAHHPHYSAEGAYTILPMLWNTLYSVSFKYDYENQFKAGTQKQLCFPTGGGVLECKTAIVGAPMRDRSRGFVIESRWYAGRGFAVEPLISRDTVARSTSVELPIYFLQNGDGKLAGGVTVGWDSKEHQVSAAIFVGSALKAFSQ